MEKEKKLIIHADDLGMSEGVNGGIFKLYDEGVVTSASLMVGMPAAAEAASGLRERPEMCAGLHVSLCQGNKISRSAILGPIAGGDGSFRGYSRFLASYAAGLLPRADLGNEIRRQCEEFVRLTGRNPTHIDSHRYIHALPGVMAILIHIAREAGGAAIRNPVETIPGKRWHPRSEPPEKEAAKHDDAGPGDRNRRGSRSLPKPRQPFESGGAEVTSCGRNRSRNRSTGAPKLRQKAASAFLRFFSTRALALLRRSGLPMPDAFYGVRQMDAGAFEEAFADVAANLDPGVSELMCHPAEPDEALARFIWYVDARGRELSALSSDRFRRALAGNRVKPASFRDIQGG